MSFNEGNIKVPSHVVNDTIRPTSRISQRAKRIHHIQKQPHSKRIHHASILCLRPFLCKYRKQQNISERDRDKHSSRWKRQVDLIDRPSIWSNEMLHWKKEKKTGSRTNPTNSFLSPKNDCPPRPVRDTEEGSVPQLRLAAG